MSRISKVKEKKSLRVGDIVELKSGSERMTLDTINSCYDGSKTAWCKFYHEGNVKQEAFNIVSLKRVEV